MAIKDINELKGKFADDKEPNGADFGDFMDSYYHRSSRISKNNVLGLTDALNDLEQNKASHEDLEAVKEENKHNLGYFSTLEKLEADIASGVVRQPQAGDKASILATGTIWEYKNGAWSDTGVTISEDIPDVLYQLSVKQSNEFIYSIKDKKNKVLFGIKTDGTIFIAKGLPEDVKYELAILATRIRANKVSISELNTLVSSINSKLYETLTNNDDVRIIKDAKGRILWRITKDGITKPAKLELPDNTIEQLKSIFSEVSDNITDKTSLCMPMPKSLATVRINAPTDLLNDFNEVEGTLKYSDGNGNVFKKKILFALQGSSSRAYPKKNYSIDLLNQDGSSFALKVGDWVEMDSFHLKANYIDALHTRNICAARLAEQIAQANTFNNIRPWTTAYNPNDANLITRIDNGAKGVIDGFACELYINDVYMGLYSWNIKKNRSNYQMKKDNLLNIHLEMSSGAYFHHYPVSWSSWEIRNPKINNTSGTAIQEGQEPENGETKDAINRLMQWCKGVTLATPKNDYEQYLIIPRWVDYRIFMLLTDNYDGNARNSQVCTWNGVLWSPVLYDLDSIMGLKWDGTEFWRNANANTDDYYGQPFVKIFAQTFSDEIKTRYKELRDLGIISAKNIVKLHSDYMHTIGVDAYKRDFERWTQIPSNRPNGTYPIAPTQGGCYASLAQLNDWLTKRIAYLDDLYTYN